MSPEAVTVGIFALLIGMVLGVALCTWFDHRALQKAIAKDAKALARLDRRTATGRLRALNGGLAAYAQPRDPTDRRPHIRTVPRRAPTE